MWERRAVNEEPQKVRCISARGKRSAAPGYGRKMILLIAQKGAQECLYGRNAEPAASIGDSKYEKQEYALVGSGCLGRGALGGMPSPASTSTKGTSIPHPDRQPRRERHDGDSENERVTRRPGKPMSIRALNYPDCLFFGRAQPAAAAGST
jgi:hypothetical protein